MKRLAIFAFILILSSCSGASDKPMPLSGDNIEKYSSVLKEVASAYEPKPSEANEDSIINIYKKTFSKLGYDFDSTYRYILVYDRMHYVTPESILSWKAHEVIQADSSTALNKGLITQRTKDLVDYWQRGAIEMGDNERMGIDWVRACQRKNPDGLCSFKTMMEIFKQNPEVLGNDGREILASCRQRGEPDHILDFKVLGAAQRTMFDKLNGAKLVVGSEGEKLGYLPDRDGAKFKVDEGKISVCEEYKARVASERKAFEGK